MGLGGCFSCFNAPAGAGAAAQEPPGGFHGVVGGGVRPPPWRSGGAGGAQQPRPGASASGGDDVGTQHRAALAGGVAEASSKLFAEARAGGGVPPLVSRGRLSRRSHRQCVPRRGARQRRRGRCVATWSRRAKLRPRTASPRAPAHGRAAPAARASAWKEGGRAARNNAVTANSKEAGRPPPGGSIPGAGRIRRQDHWVDVRCTACAAVAAHVRVLCAAPGCSLPPPPERAALKQASRRAAALPHTPCRCWRSSVILRRCKDRGWCASRPPLPLSRCTLARRQSGAHAAAAKQLCCGAQRGTARATRSPCPLYKGAWGT